MKLKNKLLFKISSGNSFSSNFRNSIIEFFKKETNLKNKWINRLTLIIDELVNNAIEHGSNGNKDNIALLIEIFNNFIKITVEDSGKKGKNINAKILNKKINKKSNYLGTRGRGLAYIVKPLSDKFQLEDNENGGITVTIKKYMKNIIV